MCDINRIFLSGLDDFISEYKILFDNETVYGMAFVLSTNYCMINCAIATIEALEYTVKNYMNLGHANLSNNNTEYMADWLKWSDVNEYFWIGLQSEAFIDFNYSLKKEIAKKMLHLHDDYLPEMIIQNINEISSKIPINEIPKVVTSNKFNFDFDQINKQINTEEIFGIWKKEVQLSLDLSHLFIL